MILKERPTKEQIREDRPDFWFISNTAWNHKDNKPNERRLLDWLIWNVESFNVKTRIHYLMKYHSFTESLIETVKILHKQGYRVFLDKNVFMIWKPQI